MVTIIGAGPIGLATGIALQKKKIPFRIVEKGSLVQSIYNYPVNMTFFSTSERLEIGNIPFVSHGYKPTRSEALEYYRRVAEHFKLPIQLYEEVTALEGEDGNFTVHTNRQSWASSKVVLASGYYGLPRLMNIPGEELPKVRHYYDDPHPYAWHKVLVVGAGNSGVDVALETFRCNAEVTMAIRDPMIRDTVKYWIKPDIENRIREGSITAWFNTTVTEIREHEVDLMTENGPVTIENDFVLAMTGYLPHYKLIRKLGIAVSGDYKTPIFNEETLETNRKGLYIAGVVCGGLDTGKFLIENTRVHADQIAADIAEKRSG